jgi:hypothetical protein
VMSFMTLDFGTSEKTTGTFRRDGNVPELLAGRHRSASPLGG